MLQPRGRLPLAYRRDTMRSIALSRSTGAFLLAIVLAAAAAAQTSVAPKQGDAPWKPVDVKALDKYRGGQAVSNEMALSGVTAGNAALNVTTGSNAISSGSFANMNGLPVVIQNTGANVLIQNAVILHLQMN
jgi:hypothetical protein